ncbi:MAG: LecA/PA-IL family lectin [Acidobacteria bacterium]|nr:LecA/PA-IL family lectin [Acidobacteriota bacterium]
MIRNTSAPRWLLVLLLPLVIALAAPSDTIRLKNGRVVKGQVERYSNGEFRVLLDSGDRMILLMDNVESVEFDSTSAPVSGGAAAPPSGGSFGYETPVTVDTRQEVVATGVQVRRGDSIRITASGEIRFADGRRSGPAGTRDVESWPFPGTPFGMLVAMVGSPTSPTYEPIGESKDFTASSDGQIYLQVNARSLDGASGSYTARISVGSSDAAGGASGATGTAAPPPQPMQTQKRQLRYDLDVPSTKAWTDTGIDLFEGDTLRITAEGTINYTSSKTCGPDGGKREFQDLIRALPVNDVGRGALVGLVGESGVAKAFLVGAKLEAPVNTKGRLFLGVNDDNYENNKGSFRVRVEIVTARP